MVLPNVQGALTQLASKRIDGVFSDTSQLAWAAKQQPQAFELVSPQYQKKEGNDIVALGLAKDSPLTAGAACRHAVPDGRRRLPGGAGPVGPGRGRHPDLEGVEVADG